MEEEVAETKKEETIETTKEDRNKTVTSMNDGSEYQPTWKNRRRVIFSSLVFCAIVWVYILGAPIFGIILLEKIAEVALTMTAFLAGSVIGSYVFGAVYSDVGIAKTRK